MSIKINYLNKLNNKTSTNLVLFTDEKFNINGLKKHLSDSEFYYISDLLKNSDLKKDLLFFVINSKKTIFLIETRTIFFLELTSKTSKFFFKSLVFSKSFI